VANVSFSVFAATVSLLIVVGWAVALIVIVIHFLRGQGVS